MAFVAPAVRWPDAVASHLPQPLKDSGIPPQYFVIVPATLLAVILTYSFSKASAKVNAPHLVSNSLSDEAYITKRSHNRPSTVVLVGLSDTGKTSLFSSLVYQTAPATLPSQKLSHGLVAATALDSEANLKPVTLVDLPGHARLRPLVDEHLSQADGLVICVDAVMASKASTSTSSRPGDAETITDVADLLHSTLTALAKQRSRASNSIAPPSVLILFTRADLSPLLGGAAAGTDAAKDEKRRAQLLARCRTTLESELGQRRLNMGLGRRRTGLSSGGAGNVKIAALGKVADADPAVSGAGTGGVFGWIKRALGLPTTTASSDPTDAEEEEDEEVIDYIDWASAQPGESAVGASNFSFDKLDDDVVFGGKVEFALASVGKSRSWNGGEGGESDKVDISRGLREFRQWIVELQS